MTDLPDLSAEPEKGINDAELKRQQLLVERAKYQLEVAKFHGQQRDLLARLPIIVTMIGGISAVLFQFIGLGTSSNQRKAAAYELRAKQIAEKSDHDIRALEFFTKNSNTLVRCGGKAASNAEVLLGLGNYMTPEGRILLKSALDGALSECKSQPGTPSTKGAPANKEQEAAKYAETERLAPLFDASAALAEGTNQLPTIFIHYAAEADRDKAAALQGVLRGLNYSAPGIEKVSAAPKKLQIRFYKDKQRPQAQQLADKLRASLGVEPMLRSLERDYPNLPSSGGVMEIWFPAPG